MKKVAELIKRIVGTLALPVAMYLIVMLFCYANGKTYFGTEAMWRTLIVDIAVSVTCAMGIGLQFKSGRFDFSGGAIMLFTAIIAGNIAKNNNNNMLLFVGFCLGFAVILSIVVSLVYVFGRLPIIITTIGMALLYEALTSQFFGGGGINLVANMTLNKMSTFPGVLVPFVGAILVYVIYGNLTKTGKQAALLSRNQQSAVNIGISEEKNVIISYIFSGLIFGFATCIYASTGLHNASYVSLSTVGELFNNILPVFVGLIIAQFCGDAIGIIIGSITLCLMNYGLAAVFKAELGNAISISMAGIFLLLINIIGAQGGNFKKTFASMARKVSRQ